jgi:hypothetical protein
MEGKTITLEFSEEEVVVLGVPYEAAVLENRELCAHRSSLQADNAALRADNAELQAVNVELCEKFGATVSTGAPGDGT